MALQVSFYQLMFSPLEKVLPRIVDKIYSSGLRACIWVKDDERLAKLNTTLWTYSTLAFLPHGCKLDAEDTKNQQPIWLSTTLENPNKSSVCVVTHEQIPGDFQSLNFDRIVDIFDGTMMEDEHDPSAGKTSFAERLRYYQNQNAEITQWQQTNDGWQKQP
jgi:DNA polymerase-3 subunit chi